MIAIWAAFITGMIVGAGLVTWFYGLSILIREHQARKQTQFIRDWGTLEDLTPKEKS